MANVIKIKTDIDTSGATAQLTSLENRITKTADKVASLKSKMQVAGQMNIPTDELKEIDTQIQKAETDLAKLNEKMEKFVATGQNVNSKSFKGMQYEAEQLENTLVYARSEKEALLASGDAYIDPKSTAGYEKMANDLKYAENELKSLNLKHDELVEKQNAAASNGKKAYGSLGGAIEKVTKRIWKLMLRVFIFSQITKAFRAMVTAMKEGFQNLAQYSNEYNKNMSNFASINAEMKNNLAAAFEPVMNMIIPALTTLIGWLNTATTAINKFFAALGGSKVYTKATKQTLDYAKGLKAAGSAQKGVLAGFDDLNVLNQNQGGGGGTGEVSGAGAFEEGSISDEFYERVQKIKEIMEQILPIAIAIGGALLAWKVFSLLETLMAVSPILATIAGILLVIVGVALAVYSYFKMWQNGVDWKGIVGYVAGIAIAVGALMALFGPIVAGIALLVAGIAGLVLAIKDICENGMNAQNMALLMIATIGIIIGVFLVFGATAAGIVTIIAAVVTILAMLVSYGGTGAEALAHLQAAFKKLGDFVSKVFAGDMAGAFEDLKEAGKEFGNFFISVAEGIANAFIKMVNAVIDAINSIEFGPIPDWVPVIGGQTFHLNIPNWDTVCTLPRLANGGITTGSTLANIGEAGREAVLPLENNTEWMNDLADRLVDAMGTNKTGEAILQVDGKTLGRVVYPLIQNESSRIGTSMATR